MRLAIISDIHGNLEAFEAVLEHARTRRVDRFACLGDVVGYGASPGECIELLQSLGDCPCLLGNHDAAALGIPSPMGRETREAIVWSRARLTSQHMEFLEQMEDVVQLGDISLSHSNPYRPRNWYYVTEKTYISSSFARSKEKLIFVGHTHVPLAITRRNFFCVYLRSPLHSMVIPVAEKNRQLFNCGSVGQPRDGDVRSSYLIYDDSKSVVEFYRVPYKVHRAAGKIRTVGLPETFAVRLENGV